MLLACIQFIDHTPFVVVYHHFGRTVIQAQLQRGNATVQTVRFIIGLNHRVKAGAELLDNGLSVHLDLFHPIGKMVVHHFSCFLISNS